MIQILHMTMATEEKFKIALIQMLVVSDKDENISKAFNLVEKASQEGANVVILPECFNGPLGTGYFRKYAEPIPGPSTNALGEMAKKNSVYLIGGTIPELRDDNIYNTCVVYSPDGDLLGKYSKMHLFDIDIPGKIKFKESDVVSPGDSFFTFDTPYCKFGIGICYDIRFAELSMIYANEFDCKVLVFPAQFTMTTGSLHWELLTRSRALDNQLFVASVSAARDSNAKHVAWGHSTVADPRGVVTAKAGFDEEILYADININDVAEFRSQIPVREQKRSDLYLVKKL